VNRIATLATIATISTMSVAQTRRPDLGEQPINSLIRRPQAPIDTAPRRFEPVEPTVAPTEQPTTELQGTRYRWNAQTVPAPATPTAPDEPDRCPTYVGQTVAPRNFSTVLTPYTRLTPRSEYETRPQYEARRNAILGTAARGPLIIEKLGFERATVHYDADGQRLTVDPNAFFTPSFSWDRAIQASGVHINSDPYAFARTAVVMAQRDRVTGSYRGSNAFGVRATITSYRQATLAIYGEALPRIPNYRPMDIEHIAPAEAMRLKPLIRLAVVAEPHEPYVAAGTFYGGTPTIDDPEQWTYDFLFMFADIQCGLVLDPGNRVIAAVNLAHPRSEPRNAVTLAEPRANLASYISDADYPASAIRANEQGMVSFHLTIGADGRVTECTITTSSGSAALDEATCRILRSRARFTPARDDQGNPTTGHADNRIRWSLPEPVAPATPQ
jgi:TonB family protein